MLMPSSVMLIDPCGRPLTVESRTVPGVLTPGRLATKSSALRLVSGRLEICFDVSVVETVDDCVLTTSLPAVTTTCSSMPPTSSLIETPAGTPALTSTSLTVAVLNPESVTVTVYLPDAICGIVNCPSVLVMASDVRPVSAFFTTTLAPGMTAPLVSVTVPERVDVEPPWAYVAGAWITTAASAMKATANSLRAVLVMNCSLIDRLGISRNQEGDVLPIERKKVTADSGSGPLLPSPVSSAY